LSLLIVVIVASGVILSPSDQVRFLDSGGIHLITVRTGLRKPEMG